MSKIDPAEQLLLYRNEIDDIDTKIVELIAKRRVVTTNVGLLKSEIGMPVFDPVREAQLFEKRREKATEVGLSADLIEDVIRRIIRDSYLSQNTSGYRCLNPECRKVVVVGGKGQLGRIFVDLFARSQYDVQIMEQEDWINADSILSDASVVIVAVPIRLTATIIQQLGNLPEDCLLADVTSIKESPLYEMMQVHQGPVVGLHPMFGPDVTGLVKQTIIVCDGRMPEKYQWLLDQFQIWGAKIYAVDAQSHDQAMSMVQVMRHFSTIAYGYHLMTEGADLSQLVEMSSPIYRLELIMVGRLFAQDPILYTDIIFANPDNVTMMKRFAYRFLELLKEVEMGDKTAFVKMFDQVSDWFGDYAETFLQESKSMLSKANDLKS